MLGRVLDRHRFVSFGLASLAVHVAGLALVARSSKHVETWAHRAFATPVTDDVVSVELPIVGAEMMDRNIVELPPIVISRGGDDAMQAPAANLADRHDDRSLVRPWATQASPSIPAGQDGKLPDRVDGAPDVELAPQSIVRASTTGSLSGQGTEGQTGTGSEARPSRDDKGPDADQMARDMRRNDYLRRVLSRIAPFTKNAFPKWAIAEGRGGLATISFVIHRDGSVTDVRVSRSSNIAEYDENCRRAVLRAAPFDPLPAELGTQLSWSMPVSAVNPAVRPPDWGPKSRGKR